MLIYYYYWGVGVESGWKWDNIIPTWQVLVLGSDGHSDIEYVSTIESNLTNFFLQTGFLGFKHREHMAGLCLIAGAITYPLFFKFLFRHRKRKTKVLLRNGNDSIQIILYFVTHKKSHRKNDLSSRGKKKSVKHRENAFFFFFEFSAIHRHYHLNRKNK